MFAVDGKNHHLAATGFFDQDFARSHQAFLVRDSNGFTGLNGGVGRF